MSQPGEAALHAQRSLIAADGSDSYLSLWRSLGRTWTESPAGSRLLEHARGLIDWMLIGARISAHFAGPMAAKARERRSLAALTGAAIASSAAQVARILVDDDDDEEGEDSPVHLYEPLFGGGALACGRRRCCCKLARGQVLCARREKKARSHLAASQVLASPSGSKTQQCLRSLSGANAHAACNQVTFASLRTCALPLSLSVPQHSHGRPASVTLAAGSERGYAPSVWPRGAPQAPQAQQAAAAAAAARTQTDYKLRVAPALASLHR